MTDQEKLLEEQKAALEQAKKEAFDKLDPENPLGIKIGPTISKFKEWDLLHFGAIVLPNPMPTPLAVSVYGLENSTIKVGDYVMMARDNSNNRALSAYRYMPSEKIVGMVKAEEIKDGVWGKIQRIDGNRLIFEKPTVLDRTFSIIGKPKPCGAICRIVGHSNKLIDDKLTEEVQKWEKKHGKGLKWV